MLNIPRKSFIPFVTAGHPDLETTRNVILALAELGSAVIEIGIPFSDPIADGPVIQRSSFAALKHGYKMPDYLQLVKDIRAKSDVGLIFMTYLNPVLQYGMSQLDHDGRQAGLDGILISDLTPEEYLLSREASGGHPSTNDHSPSTVNCQLSIESSRPTTRLVEPFEQLQTIFLVAPTSSEQRIQTVCEATTGFVYLIARTGVTGKHTEFDQTVPETARCIRRYTDRPICVGFGVRSRADIERVWSFADGAIVGSAIVDFMEKHQAEGDLAKRVSDYVRAEMLHS
ncbi:MAG: tryptophan synthase subunit alpha [Acidobacteriota bacterium]|nr:MAG: tryptophan synthase subunit alpha [Acidobacteriota bacterium]